MFGASYIIIAAFFAMAGFSNLAAEVFWLAILWFFLAAMMILDVCLQAFVGGESFIVLHEDAGELYHHRNSHWNCVEILQKDSIDTYFRYYRDLPFLWMLSRVLGRIKVPEFQ